jgi:hypothetical protein
VTTVLPTTAAPPAPPTAAADSLPRRPAPGEGPAQAFVALIGPGHLLTGLALLFAAEWFYANVGTFPPFDRHYAGDLGAYQLAFGVGLLAIVGPWGG